MYKGKTFLGVIPARGGSKRLLRKNMLNLAGRPLIEWTIEAALKSKYLDRSVVVSDDDEILEAAESCGIDRLKIPNSLANDAASIFDVIEHTIKIFGDYDYLVLLQPTSPLRNDCHINESIELLIHRSADAIISVCQAEHNPLWMNTLPKNLSMEKFLKEEVRNKKSQELPTYFMLNGAIYICSTEVLQTEKTLFARQNIFAYVMDRLSSVDIDDEIDLKFANLLKSI